MRRVALGAFALVLAFTNVARADAPFAEPMFPKHIEHTKIPSASDPGYFNGLGTYGRYWEATTNTSFDTNRVFTERAALGVAVPIRFVSPLVTLVVRTSFGVNADTTSSYYGIQGPIASIGVRDRSKDANFWVEFGMRVLPNYSSPNDMNPNAQQAALRSMFSSGIADDAAWLPLNDFGTQIYAWFQSRTPAWHMVQGTWIYFGAQYGGEASLAPLVVKTWLGPQTGFIGNLYLDIFFGIPTLWNKAANVQLGLHGEASLSSIWPGNDPFPVLGNFFLGWSPKSWFALRVFAGFSGSPNNTLDNQYGAHLAFYVP